VDGEERRPATEAGRGGICPEAPAAEAPAAEAGRGGSTQIRPRQRREGAGSATTDGQQQGSAWTAADLDGFRDDGRAAAGSARRRTGRTGSAKADVNRGGADEPAGGRKVEAGPRRRRRKTATAAGRRQWWLKKI
jgi:hypothetical protein